MALMLIISTLVLLFVVHRIVSAWRLLQSVGFLPGQRVFFGITGVLYHVLPRIPGLSLGKDYAFHDKHQIFEHVQCDAYALISFWPKPTLDINLADAAAIKDVFKRLPKYLDLLEALNFFGHNVLTAEGDEWKRYRKVSAPSFSEQNNRLVWGETLRIVDDLMENVWGDKDATVDHGVDFTFPLSLLVIGAAGFGQRASWGEGATVLPGNHQMTFRDSLYITSSNFMVNLQVPDWLKSFHPKLRKIKLATDEMKAYIREMIKERQTSAAQSDQHDLLTTLIRASQEESDEMSLSEDELMGNIWIFLVAGHETIANTLAFAFALLAVYPDVQKKLLEHIRAVLPGGRRPTYDDMPNLTYVTAIYYETLRMFPASIGLYRKAPEDTSVVVGNSINEETKRIPIPKGSIVSLHTPGVHYNPRYWENPHEFIPERFLKDWNRDAFLPWSSGHRACPGRKFSETEGIATLTSIISRYQVEIKEEPQFKHEAIEERRARILKAEYLLTLAPKRLPFYFRRRMD